MSRCRTRKFLLEPTRHQIAALEGMLAFQCELYNAALEHRRGTWKWERRSVSYVEQCRVLTGLREFRPEVLAFGVTLCRGTLLRLDRTFAAFYRRCQRGKTPGFPRFKGSGRFHSLQWEDRCGWTLQVDKSRIRICGLGEVKVKFHREIKGTPKAITIKREGNRYWLSVRCVDVPAEPLPSTGKQAGIDLGVGVLVATSDGDLIENPRHLKRSGEKLARAHQDVSRKMKGSRRWKKAKAKVAGLHRKIANQRRDTHHKISRELVNDYDVIVHEDLRITNMTRRPKPRPNQEGGFDPNGAVAKSGLNKAISDAGWGGFLAMVAYKAESAGRQVIVVDPKNTSRTCHHCGHTDAGNRRGAVFRCLSCGHEAHADVNAARNIYRAGRAQQLLAA